MKLVYQYVAIFFNLSPTSNHLHPLQVENCGSNSRLVVDEGDNGKFRLERVNQSIAIHDVNNTPCLIIWSHSDLFKIFYSVYICICMLRGSTHYCAIAPRVLSHHIVDFLGSRQMQTAPTSIEMK